MNSEIDICPVFENRVRSLAKESATKACSCPKDLAQDDDDDGVEGPRSNRNQRQHPTKRRQSVKMSDDQATFNDEKGESPNR